MRITAVILLFIALIAITIINIHDNIHTVLPGQVYRSAQLNPPTLSKVIQKYQIKSIINLRGKNPTFKSYQDEINTAINLHVQHFDLRLNSHTLPTAAQLQQLIKLLQTAPRPLLIHCRSGADRSGLASAIVLELNNQSNLQKIQHQFSISYLVMRNDSIGKLVFNYYDNWLTKNNYKNSEKHFLEWAYSENPFRM